MGARFKIPPWNSNNQLVKVFAQTNEALQTAVEKLNKIKETMYITKIAIIPEKDIPSVTAKTQEAEMLFHV